MAQRSASWRCDWYDESQPFLYAQHRTTPCQEYDSFDVCVDEFYSRTESQSSSRRLYSRYSREPERCCLCVGYLCWYATD